MAKLPKDTCGTRKFEKVGDNKVLAHREDGSTFEGTYDPSLVRLKGEKHRGAKSNGRWMPHKIAIRNVMSNETRKELGLPEDPSLEK